MDLGNFSLVATRTALEEVFLKIRDGRHESADITDVDSKSIRDLEESLFEKSAGTVSDHTIAFHLPETKTTISSTTLNRLASENLDRSSGPSMNLVVNHMSEALVIGGS